ncbi:unnamed protein product [Rotaria sp. Silwood1]|nr:unnamed protein product [Rotaria sp. Silwood1]
MDLFFKDYSCSYWHGRVPHQGLLYLSKKAPKVISELKCDFDAKCRSEIYRYSFRLPLNEHLDALSSSLYLQFNNNYTEERQAFEKIREAAWYIHFAIYGRGSTMYRINELYELIFQGVL